MPPVDGRIIKDRATRLRAAGEAQVAKHLAAWVGTSQPVLMENPRMGRTPHFAETTFDSDQPEGQIVQAHLDATSNGQLVARARSAA
jgi:threonylcarbamoyladenosine tRNA methylthiotransferase MtaB